MLWICSISSKAFLRRCHCVAMCMYTVYAREISLCGPEMVEQPGTDNFCQYDHMQATKLQLLPYCGQLRVR